MGWCHEFGTQVNLGCEHPMTAGPDACHCEVCGFVCHGKFAGCPEVWARGPRPITLLRPPQPPGHLRGNPTQVNDIPLDDRLGSTRETLPLHDPLPPVNPFLPVEASERQEATEPVEQAQPLAPPADHERPLLSWNPMTPEPPRREEPAQVAWEAPLVEGWPRQEPVHEEVETDAEPPGREPELGPMAPGWVSASAIPSEPPEWPSMLVPAPGEPTGPNLAGTREEAASLTRGFGGQGGGDGFERAFLELRGELRSWMNAALDGLRSDFQAKTSELLERQIAVEGLVKVVTDLQARQIAMADLLESTNPASMQAAGTGLGEMRDALSRQVEIMARQSEYLARHNESLSGQIEIMARQSEILSSHNAAVSGQIGALSSQIEGLSNPAPDEAEVESERATRALLEDLVQSARAGQRLVELADELPDKIAASVSSSLRSEDNAAAGIRESVSDLLTVLAGVQSAAGELRERMGELSQGQLASSEPQRDQRLSPALPAAEEVAATLAPPPEPEPEPVLAFQPPAPEPEPSVEESPVAPVAATGVWPPVTPAIPPSPVLVEQPRQAPAPTPQPSGWRLRRARKRPTAVPPSPVSPPSPVPPPPSAEPTWSIDERSQPPAPPVEPLPSEGAPEPSGPDDWRVHTAPTPVIKVEPEPALGWEPGQAPPPPLTDAEEAAAEALEAVEASGAEPIEPAPVPAPAKAKAKGKSKEPATPAEIFDFDRFPKSAAPSVLAEPAERPPARQTSPPPPAAVAPAERPKQRVKALARLEDTWDPIVAQFIGGGITRSPEVEPWFAAYAGEVHYDALPEPFVGPLTGKPKAVILTPNPGPAFAHLHARDGRFASAIKRAGSYTDWVALGPDKDVPVGRKNAHANHRRFVEQWLEEKPVEATDLVSFELYPWPTTSWTSRLDLNSAVLQLLDRFVIEPAAALHPPWVFAFGAEWFQVLEGLKFTERLTLGAEKGLTWPGAAPSRVVSVFEHDRKGLRVVAMRHRGSAGPPKPAEVAPLRDLIASSLGNGSSATEPARPRRGSRAKR